MSTTPNSAIGPQGIAVGVALPLTANTNYTTTPPAQVLLLFQASPNGARVRKVAAMPKVNVAASEIQLFRDLDGTGTAKHYFQSALMGAFAFATNLKTPETDFGYSESKYLDLAPNEKLYAGISVANAVIVYCEAHNL